MGLRSTAKRLSRWIQLTFIEPWQLFGSVAFIATVMVAIAAFTYASHTTPSHRNSVVRNIPVRAVSAARSYQAVAGTQANPASTTAGARAGAPRTGQLKFSGSSVHRPIANAASPRPTPTPPAATDNPPTPSLTMHQAGLTITADAAGSTDSQSTGSLSYLFNFGDGNTAGPATSSVATWTYATGGTYTVSVVVTDSAGLWSSTGATVTVP